MTFSWFSFGTFESRNFVTWIQVHFSRITQKFRINSGHGSDKQQHCFEQCTFVQYDVFVVSENSTDRVSGVSVSRTVGQFESESQTKSKGWIMYKSFVAKDNCRMKVN